ncbi:MULTISPECIES: hypothetical protein [Cryobacterium]|jgi:release factor glutamine methyltransferase|uniref:Uncharacterized protein n=1 Tax=Cryobacterium lyxosi TaxID=1259228 RepID=A0A4R8ZCR5_9MICO|nr:MULTISPECIES: hypothetical protein [Cryobacterium]TFD25122.1 hypothetical protein E3T27_10100 [Cryobacterium lyxosi]
MSATTANLIARLRAAGCVFAEEEDQLLLSVQQSSAELNAMVDHRVGGFVIEGDAHDSPSHRTPRSRRPRH